MSFHVAPLNPVSGTRKFLPELCPELPSKFGRGIGCTGGDHRITIWSELVPAVAIVVVSASLASAHVHTVRFESSSNRCPLSLGAPAFKPCARGQARVNISIKHTRIPLVGFIRGPDPRIRHVRGEMIFGRNDFSVTFGEVEVLVEGAA